ncbi:MAG: ATP-binding cassette domain-containing protein [Clostridia bacterium]|nr:ATP-binding cassette domain-containing protein [Clostridia bacterium]
MEMRHISKRFSDSTGIADFSLCLEKGKIHGLAGGRQAGKTLLARMLGGLCLPDSGSILIDGEKVNLRNPRDAAAWGIGNAGEESPYIIGLSLIEHLLLGAEFAPCGRMNQRTARKLAEELCEQYGIPLDVSLRAEELSRADWLWAEILRMLLQEKDILVLDAPDEIFTPQEMDGLAAVLRKACREGSAALILSRSMETLNACCDEVTVLPDASPVDSTQTPVKKEIAPGGIVLEARRFTVRDMESEADPAAGLSCEVRAGEILCLLGRPDHGWDQVGAALMGTGSNVSGLVRLLGKEITHASARKRLAMGMAYLPKDWTRLGMIEGFTLEENLALERYREFREGGWIHRRLRRNEARKMLAESGLTDTAALKDFPGDLEDEELFRLLLARALDRKPVLLIAEEPIRRASAETAAFIRETLFAHRANHRAALVLTSQPEEAMELADRILVLHDGEIMGEFDPAYTMTRELGWYMSGQWRQQRYGGSAIEGEDA